ncbi:MAG: Conserved putative rane protein [Phycisphaerales bacterium]|nr:Conserved putative rane protein [Phycisphaerales bacterium]
MNTDNQILTSLSRVAARRRFLQAAVAGVGTLGLTRAGLAAPATTPDIPPTQGLRGGRSKARDQDILNFALNFEYLGAELYMRATTGEGLSGADITGEGPNAAAAGTTTGGRKVTFETKLAADLAAELAADELGHVRFVRSATTRTIAKPAIDLDTSFTAAARAAGLIGATETFDAFASEDNLLLAGFMLEDVCVTALRGSASLLAEPAVIASAAGLLATEGYHAAAIRTMLAQKGLGAKTVNLSDLRDTADGSPDLDQPVVNPDGTLNIVPTDANGLVFGRTPGQVLAIAYLNPTAESGGFFPNGVNGRIR